MITMQEPIWIRYLIVMALVSVVRGISESTMYSIHDSYDGSARFRTARRRMLPERSAPDYYDVLRLEVEQSMDSGDESFATVVKEPNSSVYQVTLNPFEGDNSTTVRLAEIKSFIDFTKDTREYIYGKINDGFAVLLAIHHFNNMFEFNYHPVLGSLDDVLMSCNVRLTTELFDSTTSPTLATQTIVSALGRETSVAVPSTTAVVASCPTFTTLPLSILTGINGIPLVAAATTSAGFDDKEQFPLFGRTVAAAAGEAAVALQYFQSIQSTHVAILFVTDSYGSDMQKAFQEGSASTGIITESIAFGSNISHSDALSVFESLKRLQYRHVYAICYVDQLDALLSAASEVGVIGEDYLYIFPSFYVYALKKNLKIKHDSPSSKAIQGIGLIQMFGGKTTGRIVQGKEPSPSFVENSTSGFEQFRLSWRNALQDEDFTAFVHTKLPESLNETSNFVLNDTFSNEPFGWHPFLYDAVTSLGVSMCNVNASSRFFTGKDVYSHFQEIDIVSASGIVQVASTGTRDFETISFVLWNFRVTGSDSNGFSVLEFVPSYYYEAGRWEVILGNEFQYPGGSMFAPDSLPPVSHEYNYISKSDRIFGYTLMSFIMAFSLCCIAWTFYCRKSHVVGSSQPIYLIMVSIGAVIMSLAIFPAGLDETVVDSMHGLDIACMAIPWLYFLGTNISSGALLAKTRAVHQAYLDPEIETIHVSSLTIFKAVLAQASANFILLLLWSLIAPLEWTRVVTNTTDNFDRSIESYANCSASDPSLAFVIIILLVNVVFLVVGTFWAYKSRNIATEYNESRYIGMSIVAVLQSWTIGLPILIVVRNNPSASFYVQTGLIFVTALAVTAFTFVPKMIALRKEASSSKKRQKLYRQFVREASLRRRAEEDHSDREPQTDDEGPNAGQAQGDADRPIQGIKIIHNPRSERNLMISGGVELSRRQLQIFEDTIDHERMDKISEGLANGDESSQNVDVNLVRIDADTCLAKEDGKVSEKQYENFEEDVSEDESLNVKTSS